MLDLCLVVVGQDRYECRSFDRTHVDCELHLVANQNRSTASIANGMLAKSNCAVFGLVHPDVRFGPGATRVFYNTALAGSVCGVVGKNPEFPYPENYVHCSRNPGPVVVLDDCSVFFRKDSGLTFDAKTFTAWSAYVPDLCLQARERKIPIVVPLADAKHKGTRYFTDYKVHNAHWEEQVSKLRAKWPGVDVATT